MLTLGQKLKHLRKNQGFSQQEVANKLFLTRPVFETQRDREDNEVRVQVGEVRETISQPTYARMENDNTKRLPKEILDQLVVLYAVEPDYLYSDKNNLSHLSPTLREFVLNPNNAELIKKVYMQQRLGLV